MTAGGDDKPGPVSGEGAQRGERERAGDVAGRVPASRLGEIRTVYEVLSERVSIGRAAGNDVALAGDLRVSRRHAELVRSSEGAWSIIDLGSHNGTFVNGARVRRALLVDGDLVSIGNHIFRFAGGALEEY